MPTKPPDASQGLVSPLNPAARDEAAKRILDGEQQQQQAVAGEISPAPMLEPKPEWSGQAASILRASLRLFARALVSTRFKFLRSVGRGIDKEAAGAAQGASEPLGLVLGFKFPSALPWVAIGAGIVNSALDSHPIPAEPSPEQEAAAAAAAKKQRDTGLSLDPLQMGPR